MTPIFKHISSALCHVIMAAFCMALAACGAVYDDEPDASTPTVKPDTASLVSDGYFELKVSAATIARSTRSPQGGEDGNGREEGFDYENKVEKITLLLFQADGGINADESVAATTIVHALYYPMFVGGTDDDGQATDYTTRPQELPSQLTLGQTYNVLVVANARLTDFDGLTLAEVRDRLCENLPFTDSSNPESTRNFIMSSTADATLNLGTTSGHTGAFDDPFSSTITVERLAARIDFDKENATWHQDGAYYEYTVLDADGNDTGDRFRLTNIIPFNLTEQSYLFKRVSESATAQPITYLGDELPVPSGTQTNYVIDPFFLQKTDQQLTPFYNASLRLSVVDSRTDYQALLQTYAVRNYEHTSTVTSTTGATTEEDYFILDYTSENTFPASMQADDERMKAYATGLRFVGTYIYENGTTEEVSHDYYLRHSDPNDNADASAVMRNGVVRNNIYRVSISKVTQKKTTEDFGIKLRLIVVPWMKYTHSTIIM